MRVILALFGLVGVSWAVCPLGADWTEADGLCFRFVKVPSIYRNASRICEEFSQGSCKSRLLDTHNVARVSTVYSDAANDHFWYRVRASAKADNGNAAYFSSLQPAQKMLCPLEDLSNNWCVDYNTPRNGSDAQTVAVQFKTSTLAGAFGRREKLPFICQSCGGTTYPGECLHNNMHGFDNWHPVPNHSKCYKLNMANKDKVAKAKANCEGYSDIRMLHAKYAKDTMDDIKTRGAFLDDQDTFRISGRARPGFLRYVDAYNTSEILSFPGPPTTASDTYPYETVITSNTRNHFHSLGVNTTSCKIVGNLANNEAFFTICQSNKA